MALGAGGIRQRLAMAGGSRRRRASGTQSNGRKWLDRLFRRGRLSAPEIENGLRATGERDDVLINPKNASRNLVRTLRQGSKRHPYAAKIKLWDNDKQQQYEDIAYFNLVHEYLEEKVDNRVDWAAIEDNHPLSK